MAYHLQACTTLGHNTRTTLGNNTRLELNCISWSFDEVFKKQSIVHTVAWPSSDGLIAITSLEIFPLRYDTSGLENRLRKRGEQFWACRKRAFVSYDSPTPTFDVQTVSDLVAVQLAYVHSTKALQVTPRYMVDNAMYRQMHQAEAEAPAQRKDLDREAIESDQPPADPFALLLPATIRGYGLHDKKWSKFKFPLTIFSHWEERHSLDGATST